MSRTLPTQPLGRTGLQVTPIGIGLAALGRPAYITTERDVQLGDDRSVDAMRARSFAVLDAAYAHGVRYMDAARSYGLAEDFLGAWLRARDRPAGDPAVGSKWGYRYVADWRMDAPEHEVKDLSLDHYLSQIEETRERLGEHLGLYQVHSATVQSGVLEDAALLRELDALRQAGVAIGLSVTGPHQGDTIDRAAATGAFDTVQVTWNLHERAAGGALARAHDGGMAVLVKEGVANGRLAGAHAPAALRTAAAERGTTPDAIALAMVLAQPWADVAISGAVTPETLESNLAALDVEVDEALDAELAGLEEPAEAYWSARSARAWV